MEVTEVKIVTVDEERLKAYVSITLDSSFIVKDLKIINGTNGIFVAMPSRKRKDGTFIDIAHPLNKETRRMIEDRVLEEYRKEIDKRGDLEA